MPISPGYKELLCAVEHILRYIAPQSIPYGLAGTATALLFTKRYVTTNTDNKSKFDTFKTGAAVTSCHTCRALLSHSRHVSQNAQLPLQKASFQLLRMLLVKIEERAQSDSKKLDAVLALPITRQHQIP
jgi:hypothetical protein